MDMFNYESKHQEPQVQKSITYSFTRVFKKRTQSVSSVPHIVLQQSWQKCMDGLFRAAHNLWELHIHR